MIIIPSAVSTHCSRLEPAGLYSYDVIPLFMGAASFVGDDAQRVTGKGSSPRHLGGMS